MLILDRLAEVLDETDRAPSDAAGADCSSVRKCHEELSADGRAHPWRRPLEEREHGLAAPGIRR